jgi:hypothetical protein
MDVIETIARLKSELREIAEEEIAEGLLKARESQTGHYYRFAEVINSTEVFFLECGEEAGDAELGVLGGAFVSNEAAIPTADGHPLRPLFNFDLEKLGEVLGHDFGPFYLQAWFGKEDWGRGVEVLTRPVEKRSIGSGKGSIHSFSDEDGEYWASYGDWDRKKPLSVALGQQLFTGALTQEMAELLSFEGAELGKFSKVYNDFNESNERWIEGIESFMHASIGAIDPFCAFAAAQAGAETGTVWVPLLRIAGPMNDDFCGVRDVFNTFYAKTNCGYLFKTFCHRWSY